ncbi:MAG: 30S ribosomal protein S20 [Methylococcales bacterium]
MANSPSALKRAKQAEKRRARNAGQRSNLRTAIKKVISAAASGDPASAREAFRSAEPIIDSAVNKGLIHRNKAARAKSRLSHRIRGLDS